MTLLQKLQEIELDELAIENLYEHTEIIRLLYLHKALKERIERINSLQDIRTFQTVLEQMFEDMSGNFSDSQGQVQHELSRLKKSVAWVTSANEYQKKVKYVMDNCLQKWWPITIYRELNSKKMEKKL